MTYGGSQRGTRAPRHRRVISLVLAAVVASALLVLGTASPALAFTAATQVSSGGQTVCSVLSGGAGYCWGDNTFGQLGNGTTVSSSTPVLVAGGYTWASISTTANSDTYWPGANTCGVTTSGVGYCWGLNDSGQVGDGTATQRLSPTPINGGYTWRSISVGTEDTCGVTTGNVAYCWGFNNNGEVGDNSGTSQYSPSLVSGGYSWAEISSGDFTTCGVTNSGVGYCWGQGIYGETGNGTGAGSTTPVVVTGGYTWAHISTSGLDTCGVTTGHAIYCWGGNWTGANGSGNSTQHNSPNAISGGGSWNQVSVGNQTACALNTAGAAYCWGYGTIGEIGNGGTSTMYTATAVSGGRTFTAISVGPDDSHSTTCGLDPTGLVFCWGYNNVGQVGDGTTTNRSVPTQASLLFAEKASVTVSATVDPVFVFGLSNQSTACNGESGFVSGAGSATTIALGHVNSSATVSGGQALSVTTNAGGGFAVYVRGVGATGNFSTPQHAWIDTTGTYATPATWAGAGTEAFGFTYKDSTASSSVSNPATNKFIKLTNATTNAVMGSTTSRSGSACVSFAAATAPNTPTGTYSATIIYTALPTF